MHILITGGAGFIGSNLIRYILGETEHSLVNLDNLSYAGGLSTLEDIKDHPRYGFEQIDIRDAEALADVFAKYDFDAVMHLAAESHVDRSVEGPKDFIETNIVGTYNVLQAARGYWDALGAKQKNKFRFHHISTDEVYGDLEGGDPPFHEQTPYQPSSPYSASKASSDHLVRAWHRTYGLPVLITNCSNNYGPYQFPEKLIPHMILSALHGRDLPVYGDGKQIRDWLYVGDHVEALLKVVESGKIGQTYNIGGNAERQNIEVVQTICDLLDELKPGVLQSINGTLERDQALSSYRDLITHVTDRPGHDRRYAINAQKMKDELGWEPKHNFQDGLRETVKWYLDQESWWRALLDEKKYELKRIGET